MAPGWFRRGLLFAAGVRADILANAPTDQAFLTTLGAQVWITSIMAAVSMTFALQMGMRLFVLLALLGGLAWAVVIFVMDRGIITSMKRDGGRRSAVIGRVVLAVLMGLAISEPLTIFVFKPEVDRQVAIDRQEQIEEAAKERSEGPRAQEVARNAAAIEKLQQPVEVDVPGKADAESRLGDLKKEVADAQAVLDTAQIELTKEIEGLSATGRTGCGGACRVKTQARDLAAANLAAIEGRNRPEIDRLGSELEAMLAGSTDRADLLIAENAARVKVLEDRSKVLQEQIDADFQAVVDRRDTGLLAQITALWHVGEREPAAKLAHILMALILCTIEVLPVLSKQRFLAGKKRPYEVLEDAVNTQIGEQAVVLVEAAEMSRKVDVELLQEEAQLRRDVDADTMRLRVEGKAALERQLDELENARWFAEERGRTGGDARRPRRLRRLGPGEEDVA